MRTIGIDIGSRSIKLVAYKDKEFADSCVTDTTFDPLSECKRILAGRTYDQIACTGYGRHLFKEHWPNAVVITEIKAAALGSAMVHPKVRTVIDIGGQDTKSIALNDNGDMVKFTMNDRCAAGTGRFLEVMATALSYTRDEFIAAAQAAVKTQTLSSMCTVFAESEIVSLVARGALRDELALGIHHSVINRTVSLVTGIPIRDDVLLIGGGALNQCLHPLLEKKLKRSIHIPLQPQLVAATGCVCHLLK